MQQVPLTQGYLAYVDDWYYPFISQWNWYAHVKKRKSRDLVYAARKEAGVYTLMHVVLATAHGLLTEPGQHVDHVDGNGLNNQVYNLRQASPAQNQYNQLPRSGSSRFKGVSWETSRALWRADIRVDRKRLPLGRFQTEEEAALAYDRKASELFGPHARLNFPQKKI